VAPRRREEIVQATIRCLARQGYTRLTMKTLASEAGVSQGILHYYFTDKAAILIAALEAVTAELERRLMQAQQARVRDPKRRLRAIIRASLETALERPEIWRVYIQFWGEMLHNAPLAAVNAALYAKLRRQMAGLLSQGIDMGIFRRLNITQAAAVIVGLLDGMALQMTFEPQALPLPKAVQSCYETVERYLRP
jgi:AcrR family transcriptional regulator